MHKSEDVRENSTGSSFLSADTEANTHRKCVSQRVGSLSRRMDGEIHTKRCRNVRLDEYTQLIK